MRTSEQLNELSQPRLRENIAAITSEVFSDEAYPSFYREHAERVGGVPGIWDICVQAAAALTAHEPGDWGKHESHTDIGWLDAVSRLASLLVDHDDLVREENFDQLAQWAVYGTGGTPDCERCGNPATGTRAGEQLCSDCQHDRDDEQAEDGP